MSRGTWQPTLSQEEFQHRLTMAMDKHEALRGLGVGYRAAFGQNTQTLTVLEVLANPATGEVALLAPNGHPTNEYLWLCITPTLCDGGAEGFSWQSDEYVSGWLVVQHDGGAS